MVLWGALDQRFDEFTKRLTLTEAQEESITRLVTEFRDKNKDELGRLQSLTSLMRPRPGGVRRGGEGGAGGGAGGGMQEMRDLMQQLAPDFETLHEDFTALLDKEQKKTLTGLLQRRRPRG